MAAAQGRAEALAREFDLPRVNEEARGRVVYDPGLANRKLRALLATAGASEAIVAPEDPWLVGTNRPGVYSAGPSLTLQGPSRSGWLGELYYVDTLTPAFTQSATVVLENVATALAEGTAHLAVSPEAYMPQIALEPVNVDPVAQYRRARQTAKRASEAALEEIRRRLDATKSAHSKSPPQEVVHFLADELGVGQLTTARALGVTPTAVRKWRRGDTARPEHRGKLASLAAVGSLLMEMGLHDPAGWVDIPISEQSTLTPLDLFIGGRGDLAVLLGSRLADPQEALDAFDGDWREKYAVDSDYEVIRLSDGARSAVPRRRPEPE
jgi:DNA-binding transcriptional regulator YiaG